MRAFIAQMPGTVAFVVGRELVFDAVSAQYQREADRPLLGRAMADAMPERAHDLDLVTRAYETGDVVRVTRADGRDRVRELSFTPARDAAGEIYGVVIAATDLARHNRAEVLGTVVASGPFAMCVVTGADHTLAFVNDRYRRIVGLRALTGRAMREVLVDGQPEGLLAALDEVAATGEPRVLRERRVCWDRCGAGAEEGFLDIALQPLRDEGVEPDAMLLAFVDVTEGVRARRASEAALRVRNELLSIASHELRTPLTTIALTAHGALAALRESGVSLPSVSDDLRMLQRQGTRLEQLVDGLLDVALLAEGRLELTLADVDLGELAGTVCERFVSEARRSGTPIVLRTRPVRGRWDASRLDQVVTNLVTNAIKYGRGRPVDIEVGARTDVAQLTVRDRGVGIAPADQARIFGRFERAATEQGGLGLGLFIARQLVEAMRGVIRVESEPGCGAMFVVELPR